MRSSLKSRVKLGVHALAGRVKSRAVQLAVGSQPIGMLVESTNGLFAIDIEDQYVSRSVGRGGYGADELALLSRYVEISSNALIVGGHIGTLAVPLSRLTKTVHVIEANPESFKLLEINRRINNCSNVTLHAIAASDSSEPLTFLLNTANSGGSKRAPLSADFMYTYDNPREIAVQATRLDDLFPQAVFDFILMDIEGSEYFALRGMPELLRRCSTLVVEFVPHHLANVANVTVDDLVDVITPGGFDNMFVPSQDLTVPWSDVRRVLSGMFWQGLADDGLVFTSIGTAAL